MSHPAAFNTDQKADAPPVHCLQCGYDLQAQTPASDCPECGQACHQAFEQQKTWLPPIAARPHFHKALAGMLPWLAFWMHPLAFVFVASACTHVTSRRVAILYVTLAAVWLASGPFACHNLAQACVHCNAPTSHHHAHWAKRHAWLAAGLALGLILFCLWQTPNLFPAALVLPGIFASLSLVSFAKALSPLKNPAPSKQNPNADHAVRQHNDVGLMGAQWLTAIQWTVAAVCTCGVFLASDIWMLFVLAVLVLSLLATYALFCFVLAITLTTCQALKASETAPPANPPGPQQAPT